MALRKNFHPILTLPKSENVIETELAYFWHREGILYSLAKSTRRSLKNISEALQVIKDLVKVSASYMVIDLTLGRTYSQEEKKLIKTELYPIVKGIAILSGSPTGKMLGRTAFAKEFPQVPVREFDSLDNAIKWINELKAEK